MPRDSEEVKTSFFVYFGGDYSTPGYIGKGVVDTGCSRFLIGQSVGSEHAEGPVREAMTFRSGNDETLKTRTLAILPVGIAGVNGVLRVYVVPGRAALLLSKEFLRDLGCHIELGLRHLFFATCGEKRTVAAFVFTLDEFWATGTQDPS